MHNRQFLSLLRVGHGRAPPLTYVICCNYIGQYGSVTKDHGWFETYTRFASTIDISPFTSPPKQLLIRPSDILPSRQDMELTEQSELCERSDKTICHTIEVTLTWAYRSAKPITRSRGHGMILAAFMPNDCSENNLTLNTTDRGRQTNTLELLSLFRSHLLNSGDDVRLCAARA